jgi:hypothetical protein
LAAWAEACGGRNARQKRNAGMSIFMVLFRLATIYDIKHPGLAWDFRVQSNRKYGPGD